MLQITKNTCIHGSPVIACYQMFLPLLDIHISYKCANLLCFLTYKADTTDTVLKKFYEGKEKGVKTSPYPRTPGKDLIPAEEYTLHL